MIKRNIDYTKRVCIASVKKHKYNFTIFLGLGGFAEITYNGNTVLNAKEFYKERKMILIAFENDLFPLPKQHPSCMDDWEEDNIDSSQFLTKESDTLLSSIQPKKD